MKILIVGGGVAGWLASLVSRKLYPQAEVCVIESPDAKKFDLEEAHTFQFRWLVEWLGMSMKDIIKATSSTIKCGTILSRFRPDGGDVYLPLSHPKPLILSELWSGHLALLDHELLFLGAYSKNVPLSDCFWTAQDRKVPMILRDGKVVPDGVVSVHANTREIADYLEVEALSRSVKSLKAKIGAVEFNKSGEVAAIVLDSGEKLSADFVFDCSGFARLIVGKHPRAKWVSTQKYFTVDRSIIVSDKVAPEHLSATTDMIGMKHGWMASIDTTKRRGRWYNFSSQFTTDEEALAEVREYLGTDAEISAALSYDSGYYDTPKIKNVMALGLASMFFEPMGAGTMRSIGSMLMRLVLNYPDFIDNKSEQLDADLSRYSCDMHEQSMALMFARYMGGGLGTPFWSHYTLENAPRKLREWYDALADCRLTKSRYDTNNPKDIPVRTIVLHMGVSDAGRQAIKQCVAQLNVDEELNAIVQKARETVRILHPQYLNNEQCREAFGKE